jgi:signal transduction histidine kinase/CheY-like chemotaxis protein
MAEELVLAPHAEEQLDTEVLGLRHTTLKRVLGAAIGGTWLWYCYALVRAWQFSLASALVLMLTALLYGVHKLHARHQKLAAWLLWLSLTILACALVAVTPSLLSATLTVVVVIAAAALFETPAAIVATLLAWLATSAAWALSGGGAWSWAGSLGLLLLYGVALAASWLATSPVRTSVEWALSGWAQAHKALEEARLRRGELYRAFRALEEATYRIERMNDELVIARREAEVARAQKARFAATISHELRGPLSMILGFSRLMALSPESYGEPLPAAYYADADAIYRNTQHLATLVDDVLDLAQIEAERLPLVKDRIDLEEDVIKKAASIVQPLAERKGLKLTLGLAGDLPWVIADQVRLRQVLLNLLTNAIRVTEHGGIRIQTALQNDSILVSVNDTGPGIAAENLPQLFREFSQAARVAHPSAQSKGSGLGLSVSKELVDLHGGTLWVESELGVGTTFHFAVPLPGVRGLSGETMRTRPAQTKTEAPNTCLVVHDDADVVRILARYIEGYRIVGLPDEREVAALIEHLHPHAVISSRALAERVRSQLEATPFDVPLITCNLPRLRTNADLQGAFGYLLKPISQGVLASVMHRVERNGQTTILIVDDEPDAVRLMESLLTASPRPYRILRAYDGDEALARMAEIVPDVVFLDLVMPRLDGKQVLARMRQDERLNQVPVVIVSAHDPAEGEIALGLPFTLDSRGAIEFARGVHCLRTLLDAVRPRYLEPVSSAPR